MLQKELNVLASLPEKVKEEKKTAEPAKKSEEKKHEEKGVAEWDEYVLL